MIPFTKLHGNGNDFILIDEYAQTIVPDEKKAGFAAKYCDRRLGIGADGVLYLSRCNDADIKMRLFQPDRSEAEMCGNGIRCLVKYAVDTGYLPIGKSRVNTLAGTLEVTSHTEHGQLWISVNMGQALCNRQDIPALGEGEFMNQNLHGFNVSVVNTGVPHAVVIVEDIERLDLLNLAPKIRYDPVFPRGTNVNFVKIHSPEEISIRTYERGVEAETLSCGTGSVASAFVTRKLGKTGEKITVRTHGGKLRITLKDDTAYMEGSAETVFEGQVVKMG